MNTIDEGGIDLAGVPDEVDAVQRMDGENYQEARASLGEDIQSVGVLMLGFDFFNDGLRGLKEAIDERIIVTGVHFILWCRYHCTMAITTLLQGHRNDAFAHLRRGVEGAAFAARVRKHPELAETWLTAGHSDETFKKYKEKFATSKIFPEKDLALSQLRDVYESTNPFSHPSLKALAGHGQVKAIEDGGIEVTFNYHQFEPGDPSDFMRSFLYLIRANRWILDVFADVFPEVVSCNKEVWQLRVNGFDATFDVLREKWRSTILETEVRDPIETDLNSALGD
jgi:hypothetical protein